MAGFLRNIYGVADFLDDIVLEAGEAWGAVLDDGPLPSLENYWQRIEHMRPQLMGLARNEHERTLVRHRAAREFLGEHRRGKRTKIRSSKYLNNLIEQDHRSIKLRLGPMLGLKCFRSASTTIAGIELIHRIRKGQFNLGELRNKDNRAPAVWNAVLAA